MILHSCILLMDNILQRIFCIIHYLYLQSNIPREFSHKPLLYFCILFYPLHIQGKYYLKKQPLNINIFLFLHLKRCNHFHKFPNIYYLSYRAVHHLYNLLYIGKSLCYRQILILVDLNHIYILCN